MFLNGNLQGSESLKGDTILTKVVPDQNPLHCSEAAASVPLLHLLVFRMEIMEVPGMVSGCHKICQNFAHE